jgi:hypothetical protein
MTLQFISVSGFGGGGVCGGAVEASRYELEDPGFDYLILPRLESTQPLT